MKRQIKNMLKANHEAQGIIFVIGILGPAGISVDIENVSSTFKGLNFVVWEARDYTYADIACLLHAATTTTLPGIKFIAFYYAGHGGIDEYGRSFILPMKEKDGEERLFIEENILSSFKNARKHCLFFFDCRLSSSTQSSISTLPHPPAKPIHSLVAYATSPGYVTMGDRGLWTRTLCEKLREPLSLSDILDQTYDVVSHDQTYGVVSDDRRQLPCYESNLGAVYLKGKPELLEEQNIRLKKQNEELNEQIVALKKLETENEDLKEQKIRLEKEKDELISKLGKSTYRESDTFQTLLKKKHDIC